MENKKTVFKFFTIFQYRQEEEFLSIMHERGWKLTGITFPGFYHFERCEPKRVTYCLDYNREGLKNKNQYVQMFSDCGWEYLFDFAGYSYFYKETDDAREREEIFCDDASRLDMMKRVFKGRFILLIVLFACIILPQFVVNTIGYGGGAVQDLLSVTLMILAVVYLILFSATAHWFYHYEKEAAPDNTGIKYKYFGIWISILLILISIGTMFYFAKRSVYFVSERDDGFTVEAEQLNKSVVMEYNLRKGDVIAVNSHEFEAGELFICVGKENKEPVFYGNSYGSMGDFTIEIQEDGRYRIECSGRGLKGVIRFDIR